MKFSVIYEDRICVKDGIGLDNVQFPDLPSEVHAIHWDSDTSVGVVEYKTHSVDFHNVSHNIAETGVTVQDLIDLYDETLEAIQQAEIASRSTPQEAIRQERRGYLLVTDWTQIVDNGLSQEDRDAWKVWRQKLRDLPNSAEAAGAYLNENGILCGVIWPDLPDNLKPYLDAPYPPHLGES